MYPCEAVSIEGFIQQLAVSYIGNGYFFYVTGAIPEHKDMRAVDAKLISRYQIDCSKFVRHRRKERGKANVQYLRYGRLFIVIATHGEHEFFQLESTIRDVREKPVELFGYRLRCWCDDGGQHHPAVVLSPHRFEALREQFVTQATHRTVEEINSDLRRERLIPFAGVRRQMLRLLAEVNEARKRASLEPALINQVAFRRRSVRPFAFNQQYGPHHTPLADSEQD